MTPEIKGIRNMSEFAMTSGSYFVGWGSLALINAGLAQAKGRSGLIWFLLSLFLGPIATLLLVVMSDQRRFH